MSADAPRPWSPRKGSSTLMTSAPIHASASVQEVPASNWARSRIFTPANAGSACLPVASIVIPFTLYDAARAQVRQFDFVETELAQHLVGVLAEHRRRHRVFEGRIFEAERAHHLRD